MSDVPCYPRSVRTRENICTNVVDISPIEGLGNHILRVCAPKLVQWISAVFLAAMLVTYRVTL